MIGYYASGGTTPILIDTFFAFDQNSANFGTRNGSTVYGASSYAGTSSKTHAQMSTQSTFTNWDFAGESVNGTDDIWCMEPDGYPYLCWEDTITSP